MNDAEKTVLEELDSFWAEVLPLIDAVYRNKGADLSAEKLRGKIVSAIDEIEYVARHHKGWEQAKFAIVAWIDEILMHAPWAPEQLTYWTMHKLEWEYSQTNDAWWLFYERAQAAARDPDVLEVFYRATTLGFRGCYRMEPLVHQELPTTLKGLPPRLTDWARKVEELIRRRAVPDLVQTMSGQPTGNERIVDRIDLIWPAVWTFILLTLIGIMIWGRVFPNWL